jgi:hypothetical protein
LARSGEGAGASGTSGRRLHRLLPRRDRDGEAHHLHVAARHRAVVEAGVLLVVEGAPAATSASFHVARRQRHRDLVALADVAHVGQPALLHRRAEGAARHRLPRFRRHLRQQRVHRRAVEGGEALVQAAHHLVGHGRAQEADGAADAGAARHQDAPHAELLRHPAGVDRPAAAEGDHRAAVVALAALDGVDARGVGHRLVHHLHHAERRHGRGQAEPAAHLRRERRLRSLRSRRMEPPAKRSPS